MSFRKSIKHYHQCIEGAVTALTQEKRRVLLEEAAKALINSRNAMKKEVAASDAFAYGSARRLKKAELRRLQSTEGAGI